MLTWTRNLYTYAFYPYRLEERRLKPRTFGYENKELIQVNETDEEGIWG